MLCSSLISGTDCTPGTFLEEEATQRAEFPDKEGKFLVASTLTYKVCGDWEEPELNTAPPILVGLLHKIGSPNNNVKCP